MDGLVGGRRRRGGEAGGRCEVGEWVVGMCEVGEWSGVEWVAGNRGMGEGEGRMEWGDGIGWLVVEGIQ